MKKIVTLVAALLLVSATVALAAGPGPFYAKGDYFAGVSGTWNADPGNTMTLAAGVWGVTVTADQSSGFHTYKVAVADWSEAYPCCNAPVVCNTGDAVHFTLDGNTYADGYLPTTNIVWNDHAYAPGTTFEVIGAAPEIGSWGSGAPTTLVGTVWTKTLTIATAGSYDFKYRVTGTWGVCDVGSDGMTAGGGGNASFTTLVPNTDVKFEFNAATGRVRATILGVTATKHESWGQLKSIYR